MDLDIKVTGMPTNELLFHLNSDFLSLNIALKNAVYKINSYGTHSQTQFLPDQAKMWISQNLEYSFLSLFFQFLVCLHQVLNLGEAFQIRF